MWIPPDPLVDTRPGGELSDVEQPPEPTEVPVSGPPEFGDEELDYSPSVTVEDVEQHPEPAEVPVSGPVVHDIDESSQSASGPNTSRSTGSQSSGSSKSSGSTSSSSSSTSSTSPSKPPSRAEWPPAGDRSGSGMTPMPRDFGRQIPKDLCGATWCSG